MNVLSIFDGMSCGQIALERAGIPITNYFASEIDKYAIKVTQANYPETQQLGCVTDCPEWDLPKIDLVIGGSPCQGFSFAGKQLNFDDPRSKLFFDFVEVLHRFKPKYFLLENVKMKQEYRDVITRMLGGIKPIEINSALVSAQNRKRLYWTNIPDIEQPEDKGVLLKDIIESDVDDVYLSTPHKDFDGGNQLNPNYNSQANTIHDTEKKAPTICAGTHGYALGHIAQKSFVYRDKSHCIDANYYKGGSLKPYFEKHRRQLVFEDKNKLKYRKLTPLECERLQTLDDNYTNHVSNTQRYKMIGNGWTVDVIAHIFKSLPVYCG